MVTLGTGKCSQCPYVGELGDGLCTSCYDKLITQQSSRKPRPGYSLHLSRTPSNRRKEPDDSTSPNPTPDTTDTTD